MLHVQIAAGPEFRQRPDWPEMLRGRVSAVSRIFQPVGIQCELAGVSNWEPDAKLPLETNRRMLTGFHGSGDWIDLGIYGSGPAGGEQGLAVPFDSRALVFDVPGAGEPLQAANMAHEIGHMLGAWHSRGGDSVMSLPPGSRLDDTSAACLRLTGSADLLQGAASLDGGTVERVQKLWTEAKEQPGANPFYRSYSSLGLEEIVQGRRAQAEEALTKAEQFAPGLAEAHLNLGDIEMANRDYLEAVEEMRKALALNPQSNAAVSGLAVGLLATGHRDEALEALRRLVKSNPGDAHAHASMGVALVSIPGRMEDGIAELREALRIAPGNAAVQRSLESVLAARKQGQK